MVEFHLGIDDTDNPNGGCTTYTMTKIIDRLNSEDSKFKLMEFPKLIRLNPNVPFKTRGNGALALHAITELSLDEVEELIREIIIVDTSEWKKDFQTEPSYVLIDNRDFKKDTQFYWSAVQTMKKSEDVFRKLDQARYWSENNPRSLVGCYAAINADLSEDFTYELIAYRRPENLGKERRFDVNSLKQLSRIYSSELFSNFDYLENRELIAPSGPDPVFCGIRGEKPDILVQILKMIKTEEPLEGFTIFKTNQGTGHHLKKPNHTFQPNSAHTGIYKVSEHPIVLRGGHVKIKGRDLYGTRIVDLMVFEPTKTLTKVAQKLRRGDTIHVMGGLKQNKFGIFVAIEELFVLHLKKQKKWSPPFCNLCKKRMTSAGKFKGYKCKSCGGRILKGHLERNERPSPIVFSRLLPVPSAHRHMTKPYERNGRTPVEIDVNIFSHVRIKF